MSCEVFCCLVFVVCIQDLQIGVDGYVLQLLNDYPKDLVSLKRAQVLCFYMGRPDLSLDLVHQVPFLQRIWGLFSIIGFERNFVSTGSTQKWTRRLYIWHAGFSITGAGPNGWCWESCKKGIWKKQAGLLGATCCELLFFCVLWWTIY